jgi:hypothetical protein
MTVRGIRVAAWVASWAAAAMAQEPAWNLKLSAFGTLGAVVGDTSRVEFRRNVSQPRGVGSALDWNVDSRFGLQASSKLGEDLLATLQVVSRYQADGSNRPQVSWACLVWTPWKGFRARVGIYGQEIQPSRDVSDLGYATLWVRPPVEVFGNDSLHRARGGDLEQVFELGPDRTLSAHVFYGQALDQVPLDHVGLWDIRGTPGYGGALEYQDHEFKLRLGSFEIRLASDMPAPVSTLQEGLVTAGTLLGDPAPARVAAQIGMKGRRQRRLSLDAWYDAGPTHLQGALYRGTADTPLFPENWRGFITYSYRAGAFAPFVTFSRLVSCSAAEPDLGSLPAVAGTPAGAPFAYLETGARAVYRGAMANQSTGSLGVRWDFAPGMDLKFQVDHIRTSHPGGVLYLPDLAGPSGWNGHMTVYSVALDFILGIGR